MPDQLLINMDTIAHLPEVLQSFVLRTYLGDSVARFSCMMCLYRGDQFTAERQLIRGAFSPQCRRLHIVEGVRDELVFTNVSGRWQRVSIGSIISVAGRYSGLVLAIEKMCEGTLQWEMGALSISREEVYNRPNTHIVRSFIPSNGTWLLC